MKGWTKDERQCLRWLEDLLHGNCLWWVWPNVLRPVVRRQVVAALGDRGPVCADLGKEAAPVERKEPVAFADSAGTREIWHRGEGFHARQVARRAPDISHAVENPPSWLLQKIHCAGHNI